MKRLWPLTLLFLLAGCAMFDDYDSFYDGGFYEQPMSIPMQSPFTPAATATAGCNGCDANRPAVHQAAYQTGEPPMLKPTAEPPK